MFNCGGNQSLPQSYYIAFDFGKEKTDSEDGKLDNAWVDWGVGDTVWGH